ncbi:MAG: threonine/serine exporter family protein [Oscillospiraceae bacterium]|nr:threonine/serine exporter family protein [Candidatus Limimonas coprohippi]MCQ2487853.1 threonine/serine exporter family protein [Clostridia bacterium]
MTVEMIIQILTGALGSLGFALLYRLRPEHLPLATLGGALAWGAYLLGMQFSDNIFVACLFASVICTLYSEILARINKIPVTVLLIPSVIPLIPGSSLYYAMSSLVQRDLEDGWFYGKLTFQYALGIALGISLVWTFWAVLFQRKNQPRDN